MLALFFAGLIGVGGLALSVPSVQAAAGINQTINFQGRLLNASGAVVPDGTYNVEFKIYQDGTGCVSGGSSPCSGTLKWTEDWVYSTGGSNDHRVTVRNGYFSVALGSITAFGSSVDWNQDTLWLSANIGDTSTAASFAAASGDGEMLPFRRLSSVPYALNSGQLGGLTSGQFVQLGTGTLQADNSTNASVYLNKTNSGNLMTIQRGGVDAFDVDNTGNILFGRNADKTISITQAAASTAGNKLTVAAGQGGTGTGSAGGQLVLQGGAAGGTNANGGDVYVYGGAKAGTGTNGNVSLAYNGSTAIGSVGIGKAASSSYALDVSGAVNVSGSVSLGVSTSTTGTVIYRGSGGSGTLALAGPTTPNTGNFTLSLPAIGANATVCSTDSVCSGYAAATGGSGYIQNATGGPQSANFNITSAAAASLPTAKITQVGSATTGGFGLLVVGGSSPSESTLEVQNSSNQRVFSVDTSATRVMVGSNCTSGRLCVGQNTTGTGSSTVINMYNSQTMTMTGGTGTWINQDIIMSDTSSGIGTTLKPVVIDSSGTTNTSATVNSIYAKVSSNQPGSFLELQNGASDVFLLANDGTLTNTISAASTSAHTIALTNTSGTQTNAVLVNRNGAGGTTTNGINVTNTAGTLTNGLAFTGTIGTDITRASGVLTLQGSTGVSATTNGYFQFGENSAGIGTVTNTASSAAVTGSGTMFTYSLKIGDSFTITSSGNTCTVLSIASDTSLTCTSTLAGAATGSAYTISGAGPRMTILGNGKVGIGTQSPSATFEVQGSGATLYANGSSNASVTTGTNWIRSAKNTVTLFVGDSDNTFSYTAADFSSDIRFNGTNVAWGDLNYHPQGGGSGNNGQFIFSTTGSAINTTPNAKVGVGDLYVNGNAGIGTNAPSRSLHVAVNNSTVNALPVLIDQAGAGDTGLEFKTSTKNFYAGIDNTDGMFKISSPAGAGGTATMGDTTHELGAPDNNPNGTQAYKVTAGASGTLSSITVYIESVDTSNQIQVGLYSDNGSGTAPTSRLTSSASQTAVVGWNTISLSAVSITSGTVYWIAMSENGATSFSQISSTGAMSYCTSSCYPMPSSWTQNSTSASKPSFYATFALSGASDNFGGTPLFRLSDTGTAVFQNASNTTTAFQVQNAAGARVMTVDTTNNAVNLGVGGTLGGQLNFYDATGTNAVSIVSGASSAAYTLTLPTAVASSGYCLQAGTVSGTSVPLTFGNCLTGAIVQAPTSTAQNTITPTTSAVVGLTVNATNTGTAAQALIVNQSLSGATTAEINSKNTSGTQTNDLLINRNGAGGTTTNGINITNTAGTLTNGLAFTGTIGTDIQRSSGILTMQGAGGISLTTPNTAGTTGSITLQSGNPSNGNTGAGSISIDTGVPTGIGVGLVAIGTSNATQITLGSTATGTITVGQATATNTISIGSANPAASATQTINIGNGVQSTASSAINVNILSGSAGSNGTGTLSLANNDRVTQVDVGNVVADAARTLNMFTGAAIAVDTINIGTGNTTVAGGKTIHIGDGSPTGSGTNVISLGSTSGASSTTIQGGTGNINLVSNAATAGVSVKTNTNSSAAFQIQNASSFQVFNATTTGNTGNLVSNGGFENNVALSWAQVNGTATAARSTASKYAQTASMLVTVSSSTQWAGVKYPTTLSTSTTYALSFYAKLVSSGATSPTITMGYSSTGAIGGELDCVSNTQPISTSAWTRYSCTFTTPSTNSGTPYIYIEQADANAATFYVDNVILSQQSSNNQAYYDGQFDFSGAVANGPFTVQNTVDSTPALQVYGGMAAYGNVTYYSTDMNKAYRFRTSGGSLDFETTGVGVPGEMWMSGWTGTNFTGTQVNFFRMSQASRLVMVGAGSTSSTPTLLALDRKNNSTSDPSGQTGAMYYNDVSGTFRCYEDGIWTDCIRGARTTFYAYTDFPVNPMNSGDGDTDPWFDTSTAKASGTSNYITSFGEPGHPYVMNLSTGTSTTGGVWYASHWAGIVFSATEKWTFSTQVRTPTLSDGTNTYTDRLGFMDDQSGTEPTNGCYFKYIHSLSSGHWQGVCRNSGINNGTCDTGSTPTLSASGWDSLRVEVTSVASFYVNDTLGCTISTANMIPTTINHNFGFGATIYKSAGTTSRSYDIDYMEITGRLSSRR